MRPIHLFSAGLVLFLLASCSPNLTTFSRNLYESQNWTDEDLKKIQFYLSDDLTLYRNLEKENDARISGGEIKIVKGRKVEEIHFKRGTPGVFVSRPKEDHFAVSFEEKGDDRYLMFGPNPKRDGEYLLLASEWERRSGTVTYAGQKFRTISDDIPRLLVNLKRTGYHQTKERTVSGRKVKGK